MTAHDPNLPHSDPGQAPAASARSLPASAGAAFLPGTGAGGSLQAVLQKRLEQIARGYDAAHDAAMPESYLASEAAKYAADAVDLTLRHDAPDRIRLKLVNAGALLLAAIDRHDSLHPPTENVDAI